MNRTALYYGVWAALCMAIALIGFFAIAHLGSGDIFRGSMFDGPNPAIRAGTFLLPFCIPAGIVAGLGWAMFHRDGRHPGWVGYSLLALVVVVVSHVLVFGVASVATGETNMAELVHGLWFLLLLHGWLSFPMALLGTAAFVAWSRHVDAF
jgi:hypothetical protein